MSNYMDHLPRCEICLGERWAGTAHVCSPTVKRFHSLVAASAERQKLWGDKDPMFAAVELGGECGEALNVVKKLERERLGMAGSRATVEDLADELGDIVICAEILARKYGIDLMQATARKFNKTSRKMGFPIEMYEEI